MKKLSIIIIAITFFCTNHSMNKYFSLSKNCLALGIKYASSKEKLIPLLQKAINKETKEPTGIPEEIYNLTREHFAWKLIKNFNLEQSKLNVLQMQSELGDTDITQKAQKLYEKSFTEKCESLNDTQRNQWDDEATHEVISLLIQMLESTTNLEGLGEGSSLIKLTDGNREELKNLVKSMYDAEGCGICGKEGAEVCWYSPKSRCAHKLCYDLIEPAVKNAYQRIDEYCGNTRDYRKQNDLHTKLMGRIQTFECLELSLLDYLKKHGEEKLKKAFDYHISYIIEDDKLASEIKRLEKLLKELRDIAYNSCLKFIHTYCEEIDKQYLEGMLRQELYDAFVHGNHATNDKQTLQKTCDDLAQKIVDAHRQREKLETGFLLEDKKDEEN